MSRVGIAVVAVFLASSALALDCRADLPTERTEYWSYRIIDGRKCWYPGRGIVSKSLLRWPAPSPQGISPEPTGSIGIDEFEARWRKLAPQIQWLGPVAKWPFDPDGTRLEIDFVPSWGLLQFGTRIGGEYADGTNPW